VEAVESPPSHTPRESLPVDDAKGYVIHFTSTICTVDNIWKELLCGYLHKRSHPLACDARHEPSGYTGGPDDPPNSGAYLWDRLDAFFDVCLLQTGSVTPKNTTAPPVAVPSFRHLLSIPQLFLQFRPLPLVSLSLLLSLGFADRKKANPELPEKKFDNRWRSKVSSDQKKVRRVSLLILSYLTTDVLAQEYELRAIELVRRRRVPYQLIYLSDILFAQSSSTYTSRSQCHSSCMCLWVGGQAVGLPVVARVW